MLGYREKKVPADNEYAQVDNWKRPEISFYFDLSGGIGLSTQISHTF